MQDAELMRILYNVSVNISISLIVLSKDRFRLIVLESFSFLSNSGYFSNAITWFCQVDNGKFYGFFSALGCIILVTLFHHPTKVSIAIAIICKNIVLKYRYC